MLEFSDDLSCCYETLSAMGYEAEINNQSTLLKIIGRLPAYLQIRWRKEVRTIRERSLRNPNISDVVYFVKEAAYEVNDPVYGMITGAAREPERDTRLPQTNMRHRGTALVTMSSQSDRESNDNSTSTGRQVRSNSHDLNCVICGNGHTHTLFGCQRFKDLNVVERLAIVKQNKLCFNCLKPNHYSNKCYMNRICSVPGCGKRHTKFLHSSDRPDDNPRFTTAPNRAPFNGRSAENGHREIDNVAGCNYTGAGTNRIVLPILPVVVRAPGSRFGIQTYALLDNGSTHTFCSQQIVNQLRLRGTHEALSLTTLEKSNSRTLTTIVDLLVSDLNGENVVEMNRVYTRRVLPVNIENVATAEDISEYQHLRHIHLPNIDVDSVGLIIGQNVPEALVPREVVTGPYGASYMPSKRCLVGR